MKSECGIRNIIDVKFQISSELNGLFRMAWRCQHPDMMSPVTGTRRLGKSSLTFPFSERLECSLYPSGGIFGSVSTLGIEWNFTLGIVIYSWIPFLESEPIFF